MELIWILIVGAGLLAIFFFGARLTGGGRERGTAEHRDPEGRGGRDLGANVNPSQVGNEVDLWPDRTGTRTQRELGARHPREHGVPGDHQRGGHHRSATAPERKSTATDPSAHAPVPGPNHVPPEGGVDFPDNTRP